MEDVNVAAEQQETTQTEVATPEQLAFQQQMEYAFTNEAPGSPAEQAPEAQAATTETSVTEAIPAAVTQPVEIDYTPFIKETFGVDSIEEAKTKWAELQALKAVPQTPKEIEFADEQSKKIHENLRAGNVKEVTAYLKAQELLESVDTMNSEQKLKLYIKMQNPKFDQELIDDEFNAIYKLSDDTFESLEPLAQRKERLKLEQRLENDVQKAEEHFAAYKQKIQLPEIEQKQVVIDEDYEAYKASNAAVSENINNVLVPAIKSLKESDVNLGFKVQDPKNQMEFDVTLAPTTEAFEKARQDSLSFDAFINRVCFDEKGLFQPQNVQRLILLNDNFDSYAQAIARQAVNAERVRTIAKELPDVGSGGKSFDTTVEKSEFQKQMDAAFS